MSLNHHSKIRYIACRLVLCACIILNDQLFAQTILLQSREKTGLKKLEDKNWLQARSLFLTSIQKDSTSIIAHYGLCLYFFNAANPGNQIDSAQFYLNRTHDLFNALTDTQAERLKKIPLDYSVLSKLKSSIDSIGYKASIKKNTIEGYDHYLKIFNQGNFRNEITHKRDEIAFQNALKQNVAEAYKLFIDKYPTSDFLNSALEKYESLSVENAIKINSPESLKQFLLKFPKSKLKENIIRKIWELETSDGSTENFLKFIDEFPNHELAIRSENIIHFMKPSNEKRWLPFNNSQKFGFIDIYGKTVIEAKYDTLPEYIRCQDPASDYFILPDKVIHKESETFISGNFNQVSDLSGGYVILHTDSGKYLYHASGWKVVDYPIQQAYNLNQKYLAIRKSSHWQLNGLNGAPLIGTGFDSLFITGNLLVLKKNGRFTLIKQKDINTYNSGSATYKLCDKVTALNQNHLLITIGSMSEVIDSEMNQVIKLDRQTVKPASFGFITEKSKGMYVVGWPGLENIRFNRIQIAEPWMKVKNDTTEQLYYIPDLKLFTAQADSIWFKDQFTFIRKKDSLHIINPVKKIFRTAATDDVEIITTNNKLTHLLLHNKGELKLYNATTGKLDIRGYYESLLPVSYNFLIFKIKGKYGIINFAKKVIVQPQYDAILYKNNWFSLIQTAKFGAYLPIRKKLIKPEYDANLIIRPDGKVFARKNNKWGILNSSLTSNRIRFIYEDLNPINDSLLLAKRDKQWQLLSARSNKLIMDGIADWFQADAPERIIFKKSGNYGLLDKVHGVVKPAIYQEILWWTEGTVTLFLGILPLNEASNACEYFTKSGTNVLNFNIERSQTELIICDN